jgi:hypothetical protein
VTTCPITIFSSNPPLRILGSRRSHKALTEQDSSPAPPVLIPFKTRASYLIGPLTKMGFPLLYGQSSAFAHSLCVQDGRIRFKRQCKPISVSCGKLTVETDRASWDGASTGAAKVYDRGRGPDLSQSGARVLAYQWGIFGKPSLARLSPVPSPQSQSVSAPSVGEA